MNEIPKEPKDKTIERIIEFIDSDRGVELIKLFKAPPENENQYHKTKFIREAIVMLFVILLLGLFAYKGILDGCTVSTLLGTYLGLYLNHLFGDK